MRLLKKLQRATDHSKKTKLWLDADLSGPDAHDLVVEMVLSLPAGHYRLHGRDYGVNLIDVVYDTYGWMPSMMIDERMMLGLQVLRPEKIYASFTLGLDAVEVKK
jgi:hypothetical protein